MEKKDDIVNDVLAPPEHVRGMTALNRAMFEKKILVPAVSVPAEKTSRITKLLKKFFLKLPRLQPIVSYNENKTVLLNPNLIEKNTGFQELLSTLEVDLHYMEINLTYENFGQASILKAVLPTDTEYSVTSFSIIGHIIHLNLKDHIKKYKTIIAEVLLDKQPVARTVVNKVKVIDGCFRNFEMEVLAGDHDFQVHVRENGFEYEFDFSKVFWNPRLNHEHGEIKKKFEPGDVVFDVFAGVGPFAIPAAKKKCIVYANDLNPDAYKWLCHNSNINKVTDLLSTYNMDGKLFISSVIRNKLKEIYHERRDVKVHILMNLPASALEFIDCFESLLSDIDVTENMHLPVVYCYFFATKEDKEEILISKYLNKDMLRFVKEVVNVRNVAPNKKMIRLVFTLPQAFLFQGFNEQNLEFKPKKLKLDTLSES